MNVFHLTQEPQVVSWDLPEDAYEQLAETKLPQVNCPHCGSSMIHKNYRCELGYCYWLEMAAEECAA